MTKEKKQEFTFRITRANETELVVILYEMLLCYLDEAKQWLGGGDEVCTQEAFRKARGCINELMLSLHPEHAPAGELMQLYIYSLKRLAHSERTGDTESLDQVHRMMEALHRAYAQIAPQNTNGPVMNNSQTVYAGLTYGPKDLTENMADQGSNRGMCV
ncbi:MAG: flagellar protein FliS [Lachnospiraceae bacterium]|nr:flagellar protein FliS [Lachnospiraceae bacterium]